MVSYSGIFVFTILKVVFLPIARSREGWREIKERSVDRRPERPECRISGSQGCLGQEDKREVGKMVSQV